MGVDDSKRPDTDRTAAPEARSEAARLVPEIVDASREVDGSLLRWTLAMSPLERLRNAVTYGRAVARLRGGSA